MVSDRAPFEISAAPHLSARGPDPESRTGETMTPATSGRKLYRVVGVSFGLLCILQAGLNVSLRHVLFSSNTDTPAVEAGDQNVTVATKAREMSTCTCTDVNHFDTVMTECEAVIRKLRGELDGFKRTLVTFDKYVQRGWVYFRSSLYFISSEKKSWEHSRNYCLQRGADLIIIDCNEEQDFTRQFNGLMWIGLREVEGHERWKWVDGMSLMKRGFRYWSSTQPVRFEGQQRTCTSTGAKNMRKWKVSSCSEENFWICEKDISLWRPSQLQ